jgi:hypothetical protein
MTTVSKNKVMLKRLEGPGVAEVGEEISQV